MSLLFASYLLFAPGNPTTRYFARRQQVALIPYIPRTLACCKASGFTIAKRRDTYRLRAASVVPPQETKWTHMPFSGHESRCCSFCNKRAKTMQHVDEEWSRMLTAAARSRPRQRDQPARAPCGRLVVPRVQSDGWVVQAARARSIPTLTAAARPTGPVAAACTAWGAGAAGDARASESARWDRPFQPPAHHCCRHRPIHLAPLQQTHRYH